MAITRFTVQWTGFAGGPGYTNFFVDGAVPGAAEAEAVAVSLATFLDDAGTEVPGTILMNIDPQAVILDEATGNMTGIVPFSAPPAVQGGGTMSHAGPAGAVVHWMTSVFRNGRVVRGRTFFVPLSADAYDTSGTLQNTTVTAMNNAASALLSALIDHPLVVWSRPKDGSPGEASVVSSGFVPDKAVVLRSRRD